MLPGMTTKALQEAMARIERWPEEAQIELAEIALQIDAELARGDYHASPEELEAIDEGLAGDPATEEEVEAAFAAFRRG
jgi:hypothetical protein